MSIQGVYVKKREFLVYLSVFMYCVAYFMSRVKIPLSQPLIYRTMILAAFLCLFNIVFDSQFSLKQILISAVVGVCLLIASLPIRNFEILYLFCLVWGCRNLNNDRVIRFVTRIVFVMIIIVELLAVFGIVEASVRSTNVTRQRYDFGYGSWAILPLQYTMLALFLLYLKRSKLRLREILLLVIIGCVICIAADVKTGVIVLVVGTIGLYICDRITIKKWERLYILLVMPQMLTVGSYILVKMYATGQYGVLERLNNALNNRLMYPVRGLDAYGIQLLSNPNYMTVYSDAGYFGIDNSYLYMLVAWGILATVVLCGLYSYVIFYCIREKNLRLLFITLLLLGNALLWNRVLVLIDYQIIICFSDAFRTKKNCEQKHKNSEMV